MDNHNINVTSIQIINFIGTDFCKYHNTHEYQYKEKDKERFLGKGIGLSEGYFLIAKHKSENCLYLKTWECEEDIPQTMALFDKSNKVKDIIFEDSNCKFYLSYMSRQGIVRLIIEQHTPDDERIIHYINLISADDV